MSSDPKQSPIPEESEMHFWHLFEHGTGLLQQGKVNDAVQLLEHAHRLRPDHQDAAFNLSGAYILTKKWSRAIPILEALSEQDPNNAMIWINLAAAYLGNPILSDEPRQRRAVRMFKRALELDPDAPSVAYNIGLIYYRYLHDEMEAIRWFRRALRTNPHDRDAANILERLTAEDEDEF